MLELKKIIAVSFVCFLLCGCNPPAESDYPDGSEAGETQALPASTQPAPTDPVAQAASTAFRLPFEHMNLFDFQWGYNDQVFFAENQGSILVQWYSYHLDTRIRENSEYLPASFSEEDANRLTGNGTRQVRYVFISPSGNKILFEALPADFVPPEGDLGPDYLAPYTLWLYDVAAQTVTQLSPDIHETCRVAQSPVSWSADESRVVFQCTDWTSDYAPLILFDLAGSKVYLLNDFVQSLSIDPEDYLNYMIGSVSNSGEKIAVYAYLDQKMWIIPVNALEDGTLSEQEVTVIPLPCVTPKNLAWSNDDQWVYYFECDSSDGYKGFELTFKRINVQTQDEQVILTPEQFVESFPGIDFRADNRMKSWRISPDNRNLLLRLFDDAENAEIKDGLWIVPLAGD